MTKDELREDVLKSSAKSILCELPTGVGKSLIAIDLIKRNYKKGDKILIVIPKLVLIDNWKAEFKKWHCESMLKDVTFTTYRSLGKHTGEWFCKVLDETHHLTDRCLDFIPAIKSKYNILLSATVGYKKRWDLQAFFPNLEIHKIGVRKAIDDAILPDPKVYLIPLKLDNKNPNKEIIRNPKCKESITINYADRYNYRKVTNKKVIIKCTQQQYYDDMSGLINWYKLKSHSKTYMDLYLRACGKRLKWLSNEKTEFIKFLLNVFKKRRVLTFCNSIEQTQIVCCHCINSKNKESKEILDWFNKKLINHITSVSILDEGVSLAECEIGLFAMLNSSEKMQVQRTGRILRHKNPIIIIPYYINTREEEIVNKMVLNYNPELITIVKDIKELGEI